MLQFILIINKEEVKSVKDKVRKLVEEVDLLDPQNDVLWEINRQKRIKLLTVDLIQTIEYLDTCSEKELWWNSDLIEELMQHFKSAELVTCIERNIKRCKNIDTVDSLKQELEYVKGMQV